MRPEREYIIITCLLPLISRIVLFESMYPERIRKKKSTADGNSRLCMYGNLLSMVNVSSAERGVIFSGYAHRLKNIQVLIKDL